MHAINIDQSTEGSVKKDTDKCGNWKENCDKQHRDELFGGVLFEIWGWGDVYLTLHGFVLSAAVLMLHEGS